MDGWMGWSVLDVHATCVNRNIINEKRVGRSIHVVAKRADGNVCNIR